MRFVVLRHWQPNEVHYDMLFETAEELLRGWRLADYPLGRGWTTVHELAPHRRVYLTYQGPLSGSRGAVRRVERGAYTPLWDKPHTFRVLLRGAGRHAVVAFERQGIHRWRCRFDTWGPEASKIR